MCDELLRHIQTHYGELRKVRYIENGTSKQLLTGQAVGVLLSMAGHAHHRDFVCYAGLRTISDEAGINKQNCSKWINHFVDAGWLEPDGVEPSGNGRGSNRYIITLPGLPVPQPTEIPKPGGFVPADVPTNVPEFVPANVPANVPARRDRTEQNLNKTHTQQKESVGVKTAHKRKLEAVAAEWAQRELAAHKGAIKSKEGWLRTVAKTVTTPSGKGLHHTGALELIEQSPDASPEELCDQLETLLTLAGEPPARLAEQQRKATAGQGYFAEGSGYIGKAKDLPSNPPAPPPLPIRQKRMLDLYRERGYSAALEYTSKETHTAAEADHLRQALDEHALSEAGIEQEHLRMSDEAAQQAALLEAGYTPAEDAELVRQLEAGLLPEAELVRQLAARFTDTDT